MCPDSYIGKVDNRDRILCKRQNGNICPFVRWCNVSDCWKPLPSQDTCRLKSEYTVPEKASRVRFEKKGELYIEVENNMVITLKNPFDFVPKYITLYKTKNGYGINKNKGYGK